MHKIDPNTISPRRLIPPGDFCNHVVHLVRCEHATHFDAEARAEQAQRVADLAAELTACAKAWGATKEELAALKIGATAQALCDLSDYLKAISLAPCNGIPRTVDGQRNQSTYYAEDSAAEEQALDNFRPVVADLLRPFLIKSFSFPGDCRGPGLTFVTPTGNPGRGWLASSSVWAV